MLLGIVCARSVPIEPGRAGSGNLRGGPGPHGDPQREAISREYSAGHIVQMYERPTVRLLKSADHFPGRVLGIHPQPGTLVGSFETKFEAGVQLMKSRVS